MPGFALLSELLVPNVTVAFRPFAQKNGLQLHKTIGKKHSSFFNFAIFN